jgi:hypothetical protein
MAFGNTLATYAFHRIRSYAEAARAWDDIPAIRGTNPIDNGKPLRRDRKNASAYALHYLPAMNAYAVRLYDTHVVTFHNDGSFTVNLSYGSNTTNDFATNFLPRGWLAFTQYGQPVLTHADNYVDPPTRRHYPAFKPLRILPSGLIDASTVPQMVVKRVNKSLAAALRKKIKPLIDYIDTLHALGNMSDEAVDAMRGKRPQSPLPDFTRLEAMLDENDFPHIAGTFYRRQYNHHFKMYQNTLTLKLAKEVLYDHAYRLGGAYYMEDVPLGTIKEGMVQKKEQK